MINNSITLVDKISSHFRYWKRFVRDQRRFKKTYSNYFEIISKLLKSDFPISIQINNSKPINIKSYNAVYLISHICKYDFVEYDIQKDLVTITMDENNQIKFFGGVNNGDLIHSFLDSDYSKLNIKNKCILDVGMNIGDSAIYFILNGASRVVGVEPFSKNFELASKNIIQNNLDDKIEIIQAGCTAKTEKIKIIENVGVESSLEKSNIGYEMQTFTIEDIIKKFDIPKESILKIDCEGCEDEIFSSITKNTIRHFGEIQIEYHNGYQLIKEKLENFGFDVEVTKPISSNILGNLISKFTSKKDLKISYVGFIIAKKMVLSND